MRGRTMLGGMALTLVLAVTPVGVASAKSITPGAPAVSYCAKVLAGMPHRAHVGDTVTVSFGLENCGTTSATFLFVHRLDGPCGVKAHGKHRYTLSAGEGFATAGSFEPPCAGRYTLVVSAFHAKHLMDRKVRHMTVMGS